MNKLKQMWLNVKVLRDLNQNECSTIPIDMKKKDLISIVSKKL